MQELKNNSDQKRKRCKYPSYVGNASLVHHTPLKNLNPVLGRYRNLSDFQKAALYQLEVSLSTVVITLFIQDSLKNLMLLAWVKLEVCNKAGRS
jgi:hypothetical protein